MKTFLQTLVLSIVLGGAFTSTAFAGSWRHFHRDDQRVHTHYRGCGHDVPNLRNSGQSGAVAVPEFDASGVGAGMLLLLGGLVVLDERRRRQQQV